MDIKFSKNNIGSTDVPAEGIEQDLFHIETYIDGLSTFVNECATPMTISIQGDWGSGKTSIMNMIKEKISGNVYHIWFNTWQFSQFEMGNNLVFSMVEVMLDKLGCEATMIEKVMSGLAGFAKKAVKVVADTAGKGEIADAVEEILVPDRNINQAREVLELKDKLQKAVNEKINKENRNRVVIFVDDLDRLQPEKAVELLEVLKLFLDCENCVFILAVDYDVVTRGIRQKYGFDVSEEKGKSFFDKIIQLPFKVPVAQYDIKNYVRKMLSDMSINTTDNDIELFVHLIQTSIGLNPRSMKRFFNTYQLLDIITKPNVKNVGDEERHKTLFSIICMQMGHEKLYQYLVSMPVDINLLEPLNNELSIKGWINEIFEDENFADNDSRYFNKMVKFLTYFYQSIQNDDDKKISESEFLNFQSILKCSSAIYLADNESEDNSSEWDDRYKNRKIAERINAELSELGSFKLWLPRKARENVKISDVSSCLQFVAKENFEFTLEYYLSRTDDQMIGVTFTLYNKSSRMERMFLNTLGDNPLEFQIKPVVESWGRIMYADILKVSDDDIVDKVSELYRRAYTEIQKFL